MGSQEEDQFNRGVEVGFGLRVTEVLPLGSCVLSVLS